MTPEFDVLLEPVSVGPKTLKNRFYQVPYAIGAGSDRPGMQAEFRATRAEGGWACVSVEACSVSPECDSSPLVSATLWDDDDTENLRPTVEAAHQWGALVAIELDYSGAGQSPNFVSRSVQGAPSQISSAGAIPVTPAALGYDEIQAIQASYVDAAVRARDAGFDIIYLYGGSDELPAQFLLTRFNRRRDRYGGSFQNRSRFWLETLERMRVAVGDTCAIATRISIDHGDGYLSSDDAAQLARAADELVDLWDVKMGNLEDWGWDAGPARWFRENYQEPWVRDFKRHISKPLVGTGRFTSPAAMARAVTSGQVDLVGVARASIADPFLPRKVASGAIDSIRTCIGCNLCVARNVLASHIACTQNATAGEEHRRGWHPERFPHVSEPRKRILIIGGGPAGLECAMVLGKRGVREVVLCEASADLGGALTWATRLPGLSSWSLVVGYRAAEIERLANVEVRLSTPMDAADVREVAADIVIAATGSVWATDGRSGWAPAGIPVAEGMEDRVLTPERLFVDGVRAEDPVVLYDCDGTFLAPAVAEHLVEQGFGLTYLTPFAELTPFMIASGEAPGLRRRFLELGVEWFTGRSVARIGLDSVTCVDLQRGREEVLPAKTVVLVTQRVSNARLAEKLNAGYRTDNILGRDVPVYRAGDCRTPRMLADAIFDGHRIGREIDSPHPERPLPYARERLRVGVG